MRLSCCQWGLGTQVLACHQAMPCYANQCEFLWIDMALGLVALAVLIVFWHCSHWTWPLPATGMQELAGRGKAGHA